MSAGLTPDLGDPDVLARLFAPAAGHKIIGFIPADGLPRCPVIRTRFARQYTFSVPCECSVMPSV